MGSDDKVEEGETGWARTYRLKQWPSDVSEWGLHAYADPKLNALDVYIFWTTDLFPYVLHAKVSVGR